MFIRRVFRTIELTAKNPLSVAQIEKLLIAVFCFTVPIGTRTALWQGSLAYFPYNTVFLYATDISMMVLVAFWMVRTAYRNMPRPKSLTGLSAMLLLGIGLVSALISESPALGIAFVARFALFVIFIALLSKRFSTLPYAAFFIPIFLSGALQAGLSWFQFFSGHSAGLWFLGEQTIGANIAGVAKFEALGTTFVRAYGTLPHPNVLAAFLIFAIFMSAYAYTQKSASGAVSSSLWLGGIALMLTSLLFTFSRSGWIALGIGLAILGAWIIVKKNVLSPGEKNRIYALCIIFLSAALFAWLFFSNEIQSRKNLALEDQAVQIRLEGIYWAAKMIDADKFFGVGPGQFVQNIERHTGALPEPWMYQPVHNAYLLIASEFGLFGLLVFLFFIGSVLRTWSQHRKGRDADTLWHTVTLALFASFLALGISDHYFFTLEQGFSLFCISVLLTFTRLNFTTQNLDGLARHGSFSQHPAA
ncbi:MAG: O-antigen ligase family protein [bacterium]|nr:O-antigen ligase family protein [bacterium]